MGLNRNTLTRISRDSKKGVLNGLHPELGIAILALSESHIDARKDVYTIIDLCCGAERQIIFATLSRRHRNEQRTCKTCAYKKRGLNTRKRSRAIKPRLAVEVYNPSNIERLAINKSWR